MYCASYGDGPPLVLLHGWGLHGGVWDWLPGHLARRFRVLVPDLPGHGRSRDEALPGLGELADALAALVATPAVWIGWSLGGQVLLAAAQRHAARVRRAVLVGATPRFTRAPDWDCAMAAEQLERFAAELHADYRGTLERFLGLQIGGDDGARDLIRRLRAELFRHGEPQPAALAAGLDILRTADLRPVLAGIALPVQLIHGGRDRLVPPAAAEYLARALPQACLARIETAGHAPFLSHAADFARVLDGFLHD
jgi:pimeloyl-[acyl-carrier protein] methyl ester esterase